MIYDDPVREIRLCLRHVRASVLDAFRIKQSAIHQMIPTMTPSQNDDRINPADGYTTSDLAGSSLPFRIRRLCRIDGCTNRYRSPGYL